jgi:hypothetical protein
LSVLPPVRSRSHPCHFQERDTSVRMHEGNRRWIFIHQLTSMTILIPMPLHKGRLRHLFGN